MLPELGRKITIDDPDRLLLNQIPLEPVVQFYLDAPHMGAVRAHPEFLYGEDRVTPFAAPTDLLRDARAERRAGRLLQTYLTQQTDSSPAEYGTDDEDALVTFLEEGVPACWWKAKSTSAMHSATCSCAAEDLGGCVGTGQCA